MRLGLSLAVCGLSATSHAQAAAPSAAQSPAPTSTSASGGLLAQIGRELSDILLQSRGGVVMIRGHRLISLPTQAGTNEKGFPANAPSGLPPILPVIGSGFLAQGNVVVTTAEVAEDIQSPVVILTDGKHLRVTACSVDPRSNLAVLIVEGTDTTRALRLGDSDSIMPGMLAVTVGTQAGFANSGGLAFIAQTRRRARSGERRYDNLIQFQGAVGPGSSGSPLLGPAGDVIGIVMAAPDMNSFGRGGWTGMGRNRQNDGKSGDMGKPHGEKGVPDANGKTHRGPHVPEMQPPSGNSTPPRGARPSGPPAFFGQGDMQSGGFNPFGGLSSIGFALPINDLRNRLDDLVRTARKIPEAGWMGVRPGNGAKPGAYVTNLYEGSPADKAGLEIGDIIVQMDGQPIRSDVDFIGTLVRGQEGQTIRVQALRNGAVRVFEVRLRARPDPDEMRRMNLRQQPEVGVCIQPYFSRAV